MILITSSWGSKKTFKMIPAVADCAYAEAIFDPDSAVLALIGKDKKAVYHMLPRLDENGDPALAKRKKDTDNPNPYAQQRLAIDTYYEYFIQEENEIIDFVNAYAVNKDFDFSSYITTAFSEKPAATEA